MSIVNRIIKWLLPLVLIGEILNGALHTPDMASRIYPDYFYKWHVERAERNYKQAALGLYNTDQEELPMLKILETGKKLKSSHLREMDFMLERMKELARGHIK